MPKIAIDESGCRACTLCVDICPVDALAMDASGEVAKVVKEEDCIGCTSCMYLCPSRCLEITDFIEQRPFHRIENHEALIAKFLQKQPAHAALSEADYDEALLDIATRLAALTDTMAETVGRGQKAFGRQSGQLGAAHLPELYECKTIEETLERLRSRFRNCFDFDATVVAEGEEINFNFGHCALKGVAERTGQKLGEATICVVFHEYWAGLFAAFAKRQYQVEMIGIGDGCEVKLATRR